MNVAAAAARLLAEKRNSSVAIVDTYDTCHDPEETFAIVPMRIVGEEVIQAVGFGPLDRGPTIEVEYNALSRRTTFLVPFAKALDAYLARTLKVGFPRIYVPNPNALEVLTIMAARYERPGRTPHPNPALRPAPEINRLGYLCRLLNDISHMPGQQIVVVMPELVTRHFVTGQIPPKDGHLGAITEWLAAPKGSTNTQARADLRALLPAASMLPKDKDEAVERRLHQIRKAKTDPEKARIQREIEDIQREAVEYEWCTLQEAHAAFWSRGLNPSRHQTIINKNVAWLNEYFEKYIPKSRRALAMSRRYELHEFLASQHKAEMLANDDLRFRQERAAGNAFVASIVDVRKTPKGVTPKDHQIDLAIEYQTKFRLRIRHKVQIIGGKIAGEVRSITRTAAGYKVTLGVKDAIRSLARGGPYRWADEVRKENNRGKYYKKIKEVLGLP